jgi:hypothetical protein
MLIGEQELYNVMVHIIITLVIEDDSLPGYCNLVEGDCRFRGSYCLHHQGDRTAKLHDATS